MVTFAQFFLSIEYFLLFIIFLLLVTISALVSIDLEYNEHDEVTEIPSTIALNVEVIKFQDEG